MLSELYFWVNYLHVDQNKIQMINELYFLVNYLHLPVNQLGISGAVFAGLLTFLALWGVSSFSK